MCSILTKLQPKLPKLLPVAPKRADMGKEIKIYMIFQTMLLLIWVILLLAAVLLYFRKLYSRFTNYGVKQLPPLPLFGNNLKAILRMEHFVDSIEKLYKAFPDEKFVGSYEFVNPMLMVRDIDLVKKVTVKDFDYFLDHRSLVDQETDPFFGRNLFSLRGQEWKDMRSTLSPAFTSSKMRLMVPLMVEVGEEMILSLKNKIKNSEVDYIDVEGKDLATRYANDVIASCAFGLKVNSHTEENNEFYNMGRATTNFSNSQVLKMFAFLAFPKIMKKLGVSLLKDDIKQFFKDVVTTTMRDREARNIIRPDMIHLLMEAKKGRLSHDEQSTEEADAGFATVEESSVGKKKTNRVWAEIDLIAQAVLFFIAGFETVSSAMAFALHELAIHPDVQEKLVQEIKENDAKNNGKFDYKSIQNMMYMDMVISEVLRKWPPAIALDRICIKDYNMGKPNSKSTQDYVIRKGESLSIPAVSFHRDPKYFPDPLKFDPERFSEENKHNIQPFTYMPFGLGPRNCIGSRFALCEVKVMLYQLLQKLEVSPCEKTCMTGELSSDTFNMRIKGGHWIRLKNRN